MLSQGPITENYISVDPYGLLAHYTIGPNKRCLRQLVGDFRASSLIAHCTSYNINHTDPTIRTASVFTHAIPTVCANALSLNLVGQGMYT